MDMINNFDQNDKFFDPNFSEEINDLTCLLKQRIELTRLIINQLFEEVGISKYLDEDSNPFEFLSHIEEIAATLEDSIPELAAEIRAMIGLINTQSHQNPQAELVNSTDLKESFMEEITDQIFIDTMNHKLNNACQGMFFLAYIDSQSEESLNNLKTAIISYQKFGILVNEIPKADFNLLKTKFEKGELDLEITKIIKHKMENNGAYAQYFKNITAVIEKLEPMIKQNCQDKNIINNLNDIDPSIISVIKESLNNVKSIILNYQKSLKQFCKKGKIEIESDFGYSDKIICCLSEIVE